MTAAAPSDSDLLKTCSSVLCCCNGINDVLSAVTFRKHPGVLGGRYISVRVSQPAGAGADWYVHHSVSIVLIYRGGRMIDF